MSPTPSSWGLVKKKKINRDFHTLEVGTPNKILGIALDFTPAPLSLALRLGALNVKVFTC
jgi:hypothetical protein